jgi:hypothetical protein
MQFQTILSAIPEDINVYIYDDKESDVTWMLNASNNVDCVILDIDNCDSITKNFISFLLAKPNVYYLTTDEITPWNLISRNRIFDMDWILEVIKNSGESEEEDDEGIQ